MGSAGLPPPPTVATRPRRPSTTAHCSYQASNFIQGINTWFLRIPLYLFMIQWHWDKTSKGHSGGLCGIWAVVATSLIEGQFILCRGALSYSSSTFNGRCVNAPHRTANNAEYERTLSLLVIRFAIYFGRCDPDNVAIIRFIIERTWVERAPRT